MGIGDDLSDAGNMIKKTANEAYEDGYISEGEYHMLRTLSEHCAVMSYFFDCHDVVPHEVPIVRKPWEKDPNIED